ncbi:MAG: site-2 protease family protein [Thermodesulfovibrionales bacterium]|nr:site-2 protease family protein [Thermodesulfovibrionales bacterium]
MDAVYILRQVVISALPILIAIILHEVAHGFIAYKLGDSTAKMMGRLTLNPIAHIDIFGTILMPLLLFIFTNGQFVFGYAKPVPINPYNFKNPKRDMAISAAGGPLTNISLAFLSVLILKYTIIPISTLVPDDIVVKFVKPVLMMLTASISINTILAVFNMMPIPPLDGGRVLMGLLPNKQAALLGKIEPFGFIIVLILVATGLAKYIIMPFIILFLSLIDMV